MNKQHIAYLSGVILGDGNITVTERKNRRSKRYRITIFNKSHNFLETLNELFKINFGYIGKLRKKRDKNCYMLILTKVNLVKFFINVGLKPGKKSNMQVPKFVQNKELFKFFLAGMFDTDGYFSETFGIMLGNNKRFLEQLTVFSQKFYKFEFRKPYVGTLSVGKRTFYRNMITLRTSSIPNFLRTVPLLHEKYGSKEN